MKSLKIDRVISGGVGRIARAIGSDDDVHLDMCNQAITRLVRHRKFDVLMRFKEGRITPDALFLTAFSRASYEPVGVDDDGDEPDAEELLYAVLRPDTREVKLGTSMGMAKRLRHLQNGSAVPLELLGTRPGGIREERALHARFAEVRLCGEWFRYTDELAAYIHDHFSDLCATKSHNPSPNSDWTEPKRT